MGNPSSVFCQVFLGSARPPSMFPQDSARSRAFFRPHLGRHTNVTPRSHDRPSEAKGSATMPRFKLDFQLVLDEAAASALAPLKAGHTLTLALREPAAIQPQVQQPSEEPQEVGAEGEGGADEEEGGSKPNPTTKASASASTSHAVIAVESSSGQPLGSVPAHAAAMLRPMLASPGAAARYRLTVRSLKRDKGRAEGRVEAVLLRLEEVTEPMGRAAGE